MTKCVVVTGHLGGLGSALIATFDAANYTVIGLDRQQDKSLTIPQLSVELTKLIEPAYEAELRETILDTIGSNSLCALINNAAVQHIGSALQTEATRYLESFTVNALAPLLLTRMLMDALEASRGTVVNVGSIHSQLTKPEFSPYSISKAALAGVHRALSLELGGRVRMVELRPAAIATQMLEAGFAAQPEARLQLDQCHPTGSIGTPDEISQIILDVVESNSPFLSGATINVDGGILHRLHDPA